MAGKQEAAACPPATSFCLPDPVEDLHHLLVDDENYGHIQTHSAQSRNCPFIETTGGHKEEKHIASVAIVAMVWHMKWNTSLHDTSPVRTTGEVSCNVRTSNESMD